jgi:hypothetical protein
MTRISKNNPHVQNMDRIRGEIEEARRQMTELRRQLKDEEESAKVWERKNSPVKEIGKVLVQLGKDEDWYNTVKSALCLGGEYEQEVHPGWRLLIGIRNEHSKWIDTVHAYGKAQLYDDEGKIRKQSNSLLDEYVDNETSAEICLDEIFLPWAQRMSKRG